MTSRPPPVPWPVWAAAALAAALRAVPYLSTLLRSPPPGLAQLPVPFIKPDWLAYASLVRQGPGLLADPFTTAPQDGRLVLLLHQALGAVHVLTGADPFLLLELSRWPLLALFTVALWRLAVRVHADPAVRRLACVLALLSGGLGWLVRPVIGSLPPAFAEVVSFSLFSANGWSTFEALFNPVWVAGLTLALTALTPLLGPGGAATARERAVAGASFLAAWLVHPYSAVAVAVAAGGAVASAWISGEPDARPRLVGAAWALLPPAAVAGALALWQRRDPVFAAASGGFFGDQGLPAAWYPVTLAALGLLALRGLRDLAAARHPWRHGLAGWAGGIALLHSSNLLNGYHFVFALHVPLALAAAGPAAALLAWGRAGAGRRAALAAVGLILFSSALGTTVEDAGRTAEYTASADQVAVLRALARAPSGHVLAPVELGNLIPAYTDHRVYAGHWFMTPRYAARAQDWVRLAAGLMEREEAQRLVAEHRLRYLVLPAEVAGSLTARLELAVAAVVPCGSLALVTLR